MTNPSKGSFSGFCECADINLADTIACPQCAYSCPAHFNYCGMCGLALKSVSGTGAERRLLTVMFVDLVGSSALSERIDAEELRDVVREYQRICGTWIDRFGGYVAQYLGDGVLAYFGYPLAHGDDTRRSAWAALAILDGVKQSIDCSEHQLSVRIGIHSGTVVIGEMGAGTRHERLALGDVPNLAARLEGLAEPGTAIVSQRAASLLIPYFEMQSLGKRPLKGFKEPTPVFALGPERPRSHQNLSPFVGRSQELNALKGLWEAATLGELQTCQVLGESGIGKSRLVEAFAQLLAADDRVWLGTCSLFGQDRALWVFEDAFGRTTTFDELRTLFGPEQAPTVLILEDAEWLDPTSRELLDELRHSRAGRKLLIILTSQQNLGLTPASDLTTLELPPLKPEDAHRLLRDLLGPSADGRVLQTLVASCDGIPLFAEELARSCLDGEPSDSLPDNLQSSLLARLDRAPEGRHVSQLAAVLGREFPKAWLSAVWDGDEDTLEDLLTVLYKRRILRPWGGTSIGFPHSALREVAYHSLLAQDRRALHCQVAENLEARSLIKSEDIEVLAHHYSAAGLPGKSVGYWQQAGVRERSRHADSEAASLLSRALTDCLKSEQTTVDLELQLRLDLIPVLTATQGYAAPSVVETCQRVLQLSDLIKDKSEAFRALKGIWSYLFVRAELDQAQQMADRLSELAINMPNPRYAAEGHWTRGLTACCSGRLDEAWSELEQAYDLFLQVDTADHLRIFGQAPLVYTRCHQAWIRAMQDSPQQARELYRESIESGIESKHPFSQTTAFLFAGWTEQLLGDRDAVRAHATECLRISDEYRSRHWVGFASALLAWTQNDPKGVEEGISDRKKVGALISLPYLTGLLADCSTEPEEILQQALEEANRSGQRAYTPGLLLRLSRWAHHNGDQDLARSRYREFIELVRELPAPLLERQGNETLAELDM